MYVEPHVYVVALYLHVCTCVASVKCADCSVKIHVHVV